MCWIDEKSVEQMLKLRDEYNMSQFVETGAFKGVNIRLHSFHWDSVISCDIMDEYIDIAEEYNKDRKNVRIEKISSPDFLKKFVKEYREQGRDDYVFMFLDAHFYDPALPPEEKWVVVNELKALEGFDKCIICLHDFDCSGLGHCCYDGRPLGFPLVLPHLMKVNPNFYYYTNDKETCSIHTSETIRLVPELIVNEHVLDNLKYTHSEERLTYRGFLYCTPTPLDLAKFDIRRA